MLLEDAMQEDQQQPSGKPKREESFEQNTPVSLLGSTMHFDDEDKPMITSQSSDIEGGSVFSSSAYSRDEDSPPMPRRQPTHSGENNRDFELIEREIGMCRPVSLPFSPH